MPKNLECWNGVGLKRLGSRSTKAAAELHSQVATVVSAKSDGVILCSGPPFQAIPERERVYRRVDWRSGCASYHTEQFCRWLLKSWRHRSMEVIREPRHSEQVFVVTTCTVRKTE